MLLLFHGVRADSRKTIRRDSGDLDWDAAHQRGPATRKILVRVLYIQELMAVKSATSLMMEMKPNSRTAEALAICEAARTLTETRSD
jgi:hypothetical protein